MKITKIIVDKLPGNCRNCGMFYIRHRLKYNEDWFVCYASQRYICKAKTIQEMSIIKRPNWCPLEESN